MAKKAPSFSSLKGEYSELLKKMVIKTAWRNAVQKSVAEIKSNRDRYLEIERLTNVPWEFVAVIHSLESGRNFSKHLHNGDSLKARTRRVPAGRPRKGTPPFTWEESCVDALEMKGLHKLNDWSTEQMLYQLERYNGWGYRNYHPSTLSPYLWSGTNLYSRGKYVADGKWSSSAVSGQLGAVPILLELLKDRKINNHKEVHKELVVTSKKMLWTQLTKFFTWAAAPFAGLFSYENFSNAKELIGPATVTSVLLVVVLVLLYLLAKYVQDRTVKDHVEGRYVPSKEIEPQDDVEPSS